MQLKILVVDDSASDRLIIQNMLSEYNTLTARDGIEAMRQLDEHPDINLLILDLNMPNMDGFEVLKALKSDDQYKNLRTIILTNYDELDNEIKGLKLGAVDYVRKPMQMNSLKARIDVHAELLRIQYLYEQKLYEQGMTIDTIFYQAPVGIAISHSIDPLDINSNIITSINPKFEQITARTKEELIKLGWGKITHPDDLEEDKNNFRKLQAGEIKSYSMEKRYIKPDGSIVWVYLIVAPLALSKDHQYNHICLVQDITERKAIEKALMESERSKSVLLSHLPGLAYRCNNDRKWTMQFVSDGCNNLTGYTPDSLLNNRDLSFNDIITPEYREPLWNEWERSLAERLQFRYEYEITTADRERKWVLELGQGIYDEQGKVEALEGIILDISDRKEMENHLRYYNEHDRWTGLYNRNYLENLLTIDAEKKLSEKRAMVGINLSTMHSLAATYGFHYTQDLIKTITNALSVHCTDKRFLFSTYANQFVFYVKCYKDEAELVGFCESVVNTLESVLAIERIGGGIGIAEIDHDFYRDADQLLKNLLIASEKALDASDGDFKICFYDSEIEMQIIREQKIKHELTKIAADEKDCGLFLQYQPILDLKSNRICGFEALARMSSDHLGLVPPMEFIPLAEKTKLIIPLGEKIIRQALCFLDEISQKGFDSIGVSINISAIQLLRKDFVKKLFKIIQEKQANPANIDLEITESVFTTNFQEMNNIIGELRGFGLKISIDDFGTQYSSLARERELNVNCLKIDKYFIDKLLEIDHDKAITGDIISMAHRLGHYVIAEGVEDEKQLNYLREHDCDKIQGYLIGKPLDKEVAIELLKNSRT